MFDQTTTTTPVFPMVSFTSIEGKEFLIQRERVTHIETYRDPTTHDLDHTKTFVNFINPNENGRKSIHAVVDMTITQFRQFVMRPAYEGSR